jgi:large-conductance mechanosensitive channel
MSFGDFFVMTNIDMWLLAGVIFCIFWAMYKAVEHDAEKHEERIKRLEDNEEEIYAKLRKYQKVVGSEGKCTRESTRLQT